MLQHEDVPSLHYGNSVNTLILSQSPQSPVSSKGVQMNPSSSTAHSRVMAVFASEQMRMFSFTSAHRRLNCERMRILKYWRCGGEVERREGRDKKSNEKESQKYRRPRFPKSYTYRHSHRQTNTYNSLNFKFNKNLFFAYPFLHPTRSGPIRGATDA